MKHIKNLIYQTGFCISKIKGKLEKKIFPNSYRLAIVPKIKKDKEFANAYGSQHDYKHILQCVTKAVIGTNITFKLIYEDELFLTFEGYSGVIFVGLSNSAKNFIKKKKKNLDQFVWAYNQYELINEKHIFDHVKIIFEQSTIDFNDRENIFYTPTGFQHDRLSNHASSSEYDIVFNGTLDRSRRKTARYHRRDLFANLLESGVKILNYNGRASFEVESEILETLTKYTNFKVVEKFGEPEHYTHGKYALNIPFHELGSEDNINVNWGMNIEDYENCLFTLHWDIFRCVGAKANLITYDCKELRDIGLNEMNCHFYKNNPNNIVSMADEIIKIVKNGEVKSIPNEVWFDNSYQKRWNFIIDKIFHSIQSI